MIYIIGSGEAGKNLARAMAKVGRRTAVVERKLIGGSCPNIACLPSKKIIYSAKVAELARQRLDLDHVIVFHESSLPRTLASYLSYYHRSRAHLSLGKDSPEPRSVQPVETGRVVALPQVDGFCTTVTNDGPPHETHPP